MTDPHEIDTLDQEEINRRQIDTNKYDILQTRITMVGFIALLFVMMIGSHIITRNAYELSMEEMSDKLYTHITNQKIHRDMFVSIDTKSPIR